MSETQLADVKAELYRVFKQHNSEGIEMLLGSVRILSSDDHQTNCKRLAEIIATDIQHRFGG